jgi:hypothetical protein
MFAYVITAKILRKAWAAGVEMRLHGELVKDAESWISLGLNENAGGH